MARGSFWSDQHKHIAVAKVKYEALTKRASAFADAPVIQWCWTHNEHYTSGHRIYHGDCVDVVRVRLVPDD